MFLISVLLLIAPVQAGVDELQRQDRQDTLYVLHGSAAALTSFKDKVGKVWTGGEIVDADSTDGTITYWAYSDRTAAEARALMMPAILGGLRLEIDRYVEAERFPTERSKLDRLAVTCGTSSDPYFITPKRSVEISSTVTMTAPLRTCLSEGVARSVGLPLWTGRKR